MRKGTIQNIWGIEKKLCGYLYGTACADALGHPVENLTLEQIREKYVE